METSTHRPILYGTIASILAAPTAFFVYAVVSAIAQGSLEPAGVAISAMAIYYFGILVSGPLGLAIGLPYTLWLKRRGRLTWFRTCSGATLIGLLAFIGIWYLNFQLYKPLITFALLGALMGLLSGVAFCVVVRPNNSFKPKPLRGSA
jgi:hypothetical protein